MNRKRSMTRSLAIVGFVLLILVIAAYTPVGAAEKCNWFTEQFWRLEDAAGRKISSCVEEGKSPNERDERGRTILHYAVYFRSDIPSVIGFIRQHGVDMNTANTDGTTAAHIAAQLEDSRVLNELLRFGADPNAVDKKGYTPLHVANSHGRANNAKFLEKHGANKAIKAKDGLRADFVNKRKQVCTKIKKKEKAVVNVAGSAVLGCVIGFGLSWLTGGLSLAACGAAAAASVIPAAVEEFETNDSKDCSTRIQGGYYVRF